MERICLDAGVLGIFFSTNCTPQVQELMNAIKNTTYEAHVLKSVLCEAYYHVCEVNGRETATVQLTSLVRRYPLVQVDLDESLIYFTGLLKCQNKNTLSYIDCMSIAYCLNNHLPFHTTEKLLKKIPTNTLKKLKVITYQW